MGDQWGERLDPCHPPPELVQNQISYDLNLSYFLGILSAKRRSVKIAHLCGLSSFSKSSVLKCEYLVLGLQVLISRPQAPQVIGPKLAVSSVTALPGFPHATVSAPC